MKDLDFDELDKAVNSLMTGVQATPSPSSHEQEQAKEKTLNLTPTLSPNEPFSLGKLDTVAAEAVREAIPAEEQKNEVVATAEASVPMPTVVTPAPAARRSGRFMDVVHPSSDMKSPAVPARSISRQGATIEPTMPLRPDTPRASTPFVPPVSIDTSSEVKPVEASTTEATSSSGGWPDPLEMTDFKDNTVPKEAEWSTDDVNTTSTEPSAEPSPLTSPFLPDTKVEKRPLGSSAVVTDEEPDVSSEPVAPREDKTVDDPNDQLPAMPSSEPPLPEELQSDMMNVEADTHMGTPKTELTHPSDEKMLESGLPKEPATKAVPIPGSVGPISIPQQYHEEPSTGDQKSGGIYDADSYHSPLEHPAKKKSGWMWIIWIIVILLVGAGAGAALYFSGLV